MKMYEFDWMGSTQQCIAREELQDGAYYRGQCRNAELDLARWDAKKQMFVYVREKFGYLYTEPICHPENEAHFDVFRVKELVETPEFEIPLDNKKLDEEKINAAREVYYNAKRAKYGEKLED